MEKAARLIAFYLPQYHPIPENDEWWGKGFTEWTNVAKGKPLFPGHYQPHIPADLGFYDLRVSETRIAQAKMAREYGIEGFCYYHYWFGGKRLLERPFNEVLESGEPDFPFCLCWANETWSGKWHGNPEKILIEQTYPGIEDDRNHFEFFKKAFVDDRYIKVDGKPLFVVYRPEELPFPKRTTDCWRKMAYQEGIKGLYIAGIGPKIWQPTDHGFDAKIVRRAFHPAALGELKGTRKIRRYFRKTIGFPPDIYNYSKIIKYLIVEEGEKEHVHPTAYPNWDNSPRCGKNGVIFHNSNPELFRKHIRGVFQQVANKPRESKIVFIQAWNEWAEGNHLEPDLKFGRRFLEVLKEEITNNHGGMRSPKEG